MKTELGTLATALYVQTDDLLKNSPHKRLRKAADLLSRVVRLLAAGTSVWSDDVWIVDSTPVECGRSRETVKPSDLTGWAEYDYCASHSRFFWGLRLHLVCTLQGLPIAFALTGAKADEREDLLDLLAAEPGLIADRPGQTLIGDKNYFGRGFEQQLAEQDIRLLRPARKGEPERAGALLFKPLRQVIESVNETFKGQLDLERHQGRTPVGVITRVMQRILALTAAVWHNDHTRQPGPTLPHFLRPLTPWNRSSRWHRRSLPDRHDVPWRSRWMAPFGHRCWHSLALAASSVTGTKVSPGRQPRPSRRPCRRGADVIHLDQSRMAPLFPQRRSVGQAPQQPRPWPPAYTPIVQRIRIAHHLSRDRPYSQADHPSKLPQEWAADLPSRST